MGWFRKKDRVIDLTEYAKREQETPQTDNDPVDLTPSASDSPSAPDSGGLGGFFGGVFGGGSASTSETPTDVSMGADEKKRRFAKRLKDMTDKMEDISNQVYHLQQRIELLERKVDVNRY